MRQKALFTIGPQMRVKRIAALFTACLDHHLPAPLEALFHERGQRIFQRRLGQMVEENVQALQLS
jgi:hypothetical protein